MKISKITIIFASILLSFQIKSDDISHTNRFYAGMSVGNTNLIGFLDRTIHCINDKTISMGHRSMIAAFSLGYGTVLQDTPIYLGVEASYQLGNITLKRERVTLAGMLSSTKITKKENVGVHAKVGFVHQRALFYLKGGIAHSTFIHYLSNDVIPLSFQKRNTNKLGVMGGIGVSYSINHNWRANLEFDVTKYPAMEFEVRRLGSYTFKPVTYTFMTGIQYLF
jgi:opacity protein-like surface antigen